MTKLEIACVICGLIGSLYPLRIKVTSPVTLADVLAILTIIFRYIVCGLMILLPLYFELWKK